MESILKAVEVARHLKIVIKSRFSGKFSRTTRFTSSLPGQLKVFGVFLVVIVAAQLFFSVSPLSATEVVYGGPQEEDSSQFLEQFEQGAVLANNGIFDEINEETVSSPAMAQEGAATPNSLFSDSPVASSALTIHTVLPGDTVFSVSKEYQVSEADLTKANKLNDGPLIVGEHLVVPQARVAQSAAQTALLRTSYLPKGFIWPVSGAIGAPHAFHAASATYKSYYGVDIPNKLGTPILAASDGTIVEAIYGYAGGYGNHVVEDSSATGYSVDLMYAHMNELIVVPGQFVKQGEVIGYVGSTGHSTGPHLHFEVREKNK